MSTRTKPAAATSKPKSKPKAAPAAATPSWQHGHFYWNEQMTRDIERAKRFYAKTLGWTFEAMPMGDGVTYWVASCGAGPRPAGGIFDISQSMWEGVPEGWMAYISVDDIDKRVAAAVKAGAKLMRPIFDVPGVGRIAILTEPGGAGIGWMTPSM